MKYWLFDGSDIVGPLDPHELMGRKGFSSESLVCPDGFTEDSDHWQKALTFEELQPALKGEATPASWEKQVDTLLAQNPPVEVDETPTSDSLHVPDTPAKPGPIEEYFNTIKGEDLGNILGIPDPNENTDADLARVLQNQLSPAPANQKESYEPFRPQVQVQPAQRPADKAPQKQPAAPQQPAAKPAPADKPRQKQHTQAPGTKNNAKPKPVKQAKQPAVKKENAPLTRDPDSPEGIRIIDLEEPGKTPQTKANTLKNDAAKKQQAAPKNQPPAKKEAASKIISKNEVEIEEFDTADSHAQLAVSPDSDEANGIYQPVRPYRRSQWLMAILACLLLLVLVRLSVHQQNDFAQLLCLLKQWTADVWPGKSADNTANAAVLSGQPLAQPVRSVSDTLILPPQPFFNDETDLRSPYAEPDSDEVTDGSLIPEGVPLTPAQTALVAVQQYELPNGRGKIKDYLQSYYAPQFAKGYEADWSASLLHKNTYIVQYRLTKTRTEPIVYVFQADGEKGLLTGALNNITLDLVGKIQQ